MTFQNPRSTAMFNIMELHDYYYPFLIFLFTVKIIALIFSLKTATEDFKFPWAPTYDIDYDHAHAFKYRTKNSFLLPSVNWSTYTYVRERVYRFKHYNFAEYLWTLLPAVILILLAIPSFVLLYSLEIPGGPVMYTVKATGNQWYWSYEYNFPYNDFGTGEISKGLILSPEEYESAIIASFHEKCELKNLQSAREDTLFIHVPSYMYTIWKDFKLDTPPAIPYLYESILFLHNAIADDVELFNNDDGVIITQTDIAEAFLFREICNKQLYITPEDAEASIAALKFYTTDLDNITVREIACSVDKFAWTAMCDFYELLYPKKWHRDMLEQVYNFDYKFGSTPSNSITFDCQIIPEQNLPLGYPRLLCTDNVLVLPAKALVRMLVTSNDVIHSWAVPSLGVKVDAIPGRINQIFLHTNFTGTTWGQCSELCGINHAFMPIEIRWMFYSDFEWYIKYLFKMHNSSVYEKELSTPDYFANLALRNTCQLSQPLVSHQNMRELVEAMYASYAKYYDITI